MYLKSLILTLLFLASSQIWANYQLKDLKILAKDGQVDEYFAHYLDIAPKDRQEEYFKLLIAMSIKATDRLDNQQSGKMDRLQKIFKLLSFPQLAKNEFFKDKLDQKFSEHINNCFKRQSYVYCEKHLLDYWHQHSHSDLGLKFYQIIKPYYLKELEKENFLGKDPQVLLTLVRPALLHPMAEFFCQKEDIKNRLFELSFQSSKEQLKKRVHPDCFKSLAKSSLSWLQKLDYNNRVKFLDLIPKKKKHNQLHQLLTFLEGKQNHRSLQNLAWKELLKLGNHSKAREELLKEIDFSLLKRPYLKNMPYAHQKVLTKALTKNFPELILKLNSSESL